MAEEAQAVTTPVVADTTPAESAPVENTSSEVADEFDGLGDIDLTNPVKTETESEKEAPADEVADETEVDTQPQGEQLSPKSENRFQTLANQNREMREELARLKARESQVTTEQDLINQINPETGDYYTPLDAERIARYQANETLQQSLAQERQNLEVRQSQMTLASEAQQAISDYPMFDANSKEYNPEIAAAADEVLRNNLIVDDQGQIVGSRVSPLQLYKSYSDVFNAAASTGQVKAQKATEKMLASVDQVSDAPSKGSDDPMKALEERLGNIKFTNL